MEDDADHRRLGQKRLLPSGNGKGGQDGQRQRQRLLGGHEKEGDTVRAGDPEDSPGRRGRGQKKKMNGERGSRQAEPFPEAETEQGAGVSADWQIDDQGHAEGGDRIQDTRKGAFSKQGLPEPADDQG